ncbi:hypothetical protein H920_03719 [Fukomys damarensis]|uniref:Uncharacterized protein n=1 Tax=Fukomys damarensis TaxID=885580 RepID=A0A091DV88_FUKDA|nr:hypothetical protein H920_03719 [Fukomys damarensis]
MPTKVTHTQIWVDLLGARVSQVKINKKLNAYLLKLQIAIGVIALRYPEPSRKPSIHAELELTPQPLPPRSLPKYGPDSSWWALLNPQVEMPQSWPTTPDFEPKSPIPLDTSESLYEMDSIPFCEDLIFQREKASPPLPLSPRESLSQLPLREVPQDSKHINKQLNQRFNAFFLDVSEEMQNRIIWWLKGLYFFLLWVFCGPWEVAR